jgi:hypothetical protein
MLVDIVGNDAVEAVSVLLYINISISVGPTFVAFAISPMVPFQASHL